MPTLLEKIQLLIPADETVSEDDMQDVQKSQEDEEKRDELLDDIMSALESDDDKPAKSNIPLSARDHIDLYVAKLARLAEQKSGDENNAVALQAQNALNEFNNRVLTFCSEQCKDLDFPDKLSSNKLGIFEEKAAFEKADASGFYGTIVLMLQTAINERYVKNKFAGQEVVEAKDSESVYVCLYDAHSTIYSISDNKVLNFQTELDEFTLNIKIRKKHVSIDSLNEEKKEIPDVKIFKTSITPAELMTSCEILKKTPDFIKGNNLVKTPFGWGNNVWGDHIPAHRNCHAYVYSIMQETLRNRLRLKNTGNKEDNLGVTDFTSRNISKGKS